MTIALSSVTTGVLTALRTAAPANHEVGDGEPPQTTTDLACAWLTRQSAPGTAQAFGGGETHRFVRYRISSEASDGGQTGRAARIAAENLADILRTRMLDGTLVSGTGWRCTGVRHDATATVAGDRVVTVHDDYVLHIASA